MARPAGAKGNSDRGRLAHVNSVLRAIRNVNQLIVREKDPGALIQSACQLLVETRGYHSAWIALFEDDGRIGSIAQSGHGEAFALMSERLRQGDLPVCAQAAMTSAGVHVIRDSAADCAGCPFLSGRKSRSSITVRLTHGDRTYGLMGVSVPAEFTADDEEADLVREVGEDIGFALHVIEQEAHGASTLEELHRERDLTGLLLDTSPVAIAVVDAQGSIVRANSEAERVLGLRKDDITQRTYNDPAWHIVDCGGNPFPDEQLPVRRVLRERRAVYGVEHAIQWSTGERVLLSVNAAPVWSDKGDITQVVCSMQDVTAQRRVEAALRQSERTFRLLFESMTSGFVLHEMIFDDEGKPVDFRFLAANPAFERLSGLKASDIVGRTLSDVSPDTEPIWMETYGRVVTSGEPVEFESYSKIVGGQLRIAAYSPEAGKVAVVFEDISERTRVEAALRESESRYRALFEQSVDAIYLGTLDGKVINVNQPWLDLYGYTREDMNDFRVEEVFVVPEDRDAFVQQVRETGFVSDVVQFKKKDGTVFDCQRVVSAQRDMQGNVVLLQSITRDVTEARAAERTLRASEERFRSLFEQSMDPIMLVEVDGSNVRANQAWLNLFGYSMEELPGLNMLQFYANPEEREDFMRRIAEAGIVEGEVRFKKKDGTVMECVRSVVALRDGEGEVVALQGVVRDITEAKRQKEALADELTRRRILLEQSRDGIVVLDQDGKVAEANLRFAQMLGYSPEEVLQLHVWDWDVPHPSGELMDMVRTVDESGDHFETQHLRKDGTVYDVEISTNGAVFGGRKLVFCVCRDITDRKRAEKELAESLELLRQLAQRVEAAREEERTAIARDLHDRVGQSLTALKLDLGRLTRSHQAMEPGVVALLRGMEAIVDSSADDVRRISSELRPGALDDLGLAGAISWQLDETRMRTSLKCLLDVPSTDIDLDPARRTALFRVFQELVTNVVRHAAATSVHVTLEPKGEACVLTVADDGRGAEMKQLNDSQSLGVIGMRERLHPYGGELHYDSESGRGTIARVVMPLR